MSETLKPRRSRRVQPLEDNDFDHEINLLDHTDPAESKVIPDEEGRRASASASSVPVEPSSSRPELSLAEQPTMIERGKEQHGTQGRTKSTQDEEFVVEIQEPTPASEEITSQAPQHTTQPRRKTPESAIDILYENQRGGFLCGIPLFASKALGNLDPPQWTNFAHNPSPTDIKTAQVPDPSWEWVWPEWRINHDEGCDQDGWEYSFAFHKKFSWHGPTWWSSFVRRRAWIRKRAKKALGYIQEDPSMLDAQYFSVRPASVASRARSHNRLDSRRGSKMSAAKSQASEIDEVEHADLLDVESLIRALKSSRIDREKIENINNYLDHAEDNLAPLAREMHEIMSLFVFQTARRVLLSRLTQVYDDTREMADGGNGDLERLGQKAEHLRVAIQHADEEVKRLEYWSDVKEMVVEGDSKGAMDRKQGWDEGRWQGLDNSGPAEPGAPENGKP